jgi:integrase
MRTRPLPPYLKRWYDKRTGRTYLQFRKRGHKPVPLPQPIGSDAFWMAYNAALRGKAVVGAERTIAGSVSAALATYYASADWAALSDSTRGWHKPILERFRTRYGQWPLRQISENFVDAYLDALKPHVARNHLRALRRFLRHAKHDVTRNITPPRAKSNKRESWPLEVMAQFEAHHPIGSKARLAFALARYTGAARSEVARIGPQHIIDGEITIARKKTGVAATITVHPQLRAILDATPLTGLTTFLLNRTGKPYAPNNLSIQFRNWCDEAGIPPQYTLHGLRHAMGDRIAELGGTLHEVAAVLGHRDVRTAAHYTQGADKRKLARTAMTRVIESTNQDRSGNEPVSENRPVQTQCPQKT